MIKTSVTARKNQLSSYRFTQSNHFPDSPYSGVSQPRLCKLTVFLNIKSYITILSICSHCHSLEPQSELNFPLYLIYLNSPLPKPSSLYIL